MASIKQNLAVLQKIYKVKSILGKEIRLTDNYWKLIYTIKHDELENRLNLVFLALTNAEQVYQKINDKGVYLYYRAINRHFVCVVTRHENGEGFIITAYLTSKTKRKGKKIYEKKK